MIKNLSTILAILVAAAIISGCGSSAPYSDVADTSDAMTASYEQFGAKMQQAENAKEAAAAIDGFANSMEAIIPEMKALNEKYPELEKDAEHLPENVQAAMTRMETAMQSMPATMMKSIKYMQDPEFQKAQQHLMEVMQKLGDELE